MPPKKKEVKVGPNILFDPEGNELFKAAVTTVVRRPTPHDGGSAFQAFCDWLAGKIAEHHPRVIQVCDPDVSGMYLVLFYNDAGANKGYEVRLFDPLTTDVISLSPNPPIMADPTALALMKFLPGLVYDMWREDRE